MPELVRIQKALAAAGVASRRAADTLVAAGRVTVNGVPAVTGQKVDPAADRVLVDGRPIESGRRLTYLALAKPVGVTSTVSDRHATTTVVDLVPRRLREPAGRIYPVGRLDRDSEGLLLLTNDGAWAHRVLHPSHAVEREYAIAVGAPLTPPRLARLRDGIELEEGLARLAGLRLASGAEIRGIERAMGPSLRDVVWYRAVLRQGWRRQLRRMFAAVGSPVERLVRVRVGTVRLGAMRSGEVRELTVSERGSLEAPPRARERGLVVSLDGPASSGKSSVGGAAALVLRYRFCDTGVLYRALTWLAVQRGVESGDAASVAALVPELEVAADDHGRVDRVRVGGVDVTGSLHDAEVERLVSTVARQADVRAALLPIQRQLARGGRIIMAGRDIGTVVLPDADLKLYIEVSPEERARRRAEERGLDPTGREAEELAAELRRRDRVDSTRTVAPLRIPDDAVVIRSEGNRLEETVDAVVAAVRRCEPQARR
jgi:cytidylate kinase